MSSKNVHGELHSTNASTGVAIPLYYEGTSNVATLLGDEHLKIDSIQAISAAGGDVQVFVELNATPQVGDFVIRGTVSVDGGVVEGHVSFTGKVGAVAYLIAPAGVVDVVFSGRIVKKD